ncbi:hypothetical protein D9619_000641 [Psilocybe cf. subviscida]|uniref:Uncharacterized protein n=1 Tax=Psilocybe cf. subviscida TaxID=2480587 RepID=A0A8H5BHG1_9AGAR|nr:hypothetical protein D9619_000641 [Psilocybe cf. subviscida]
MGRDDGRRSRQVQHVHHSRFRLSKSFAIHSMFMSSQSPPQKSTFQDILQSADLPEPGPEYYAARRRLWLTPRPETGTPPPLSPTRKELEEEVAKQSALHNPKSWTPTMDKMWRRLSNGRPLKYPLPLHFIIKVIHSFWIHDHTWPAGMEVPPSDEEQQEEERIIPVIDSSAASSTPAISTRIPLSAVTSGTMVDTSSSSMPR